MKKELLEKLAKDLPLTAHEAHELDQILEEQEQLGVSHLVRRAASDEPSLAWRSSLNLALTAMAPAKPKRNPWLVFGTVLAPAAAAVALALFITKPGFETQVPQPSSPALAYESSQDLESALLMVHQREEASTMNASSPPSPDGRYFEWSDLGPY